MYSELLENREMHALLREPQPVAKQLEDALVEEVQQAAEQMETFSASSGHCNQVPQPAAKQFIYAMVQSQPADAKQQACTTVSNLTHLTL